MRVLSSSVSSVLMLRDGFGPAMMIPSRPDICKESHCSVLPPYILTNITNHPNAPESAKACARNALRFTSTCHQRRNDFINRRLNATQGHPSGFVSGIILNNITSSAGTQSKSAGPKRLNRVVYTANNTEILDYTLLRSEGGAATNDAAADECYDGFGSTFNFYSDVFDRNSINDAGMTLIGTVHYEQASNDAKWDGAQMIFGDGDGVYFNRFTSSLDVIGHELTHGVTQYTANLVYQGQSGALNESMSDVFGIMVKQYKQNQSSAQSDWLIGAGLFTWQVKGVALRSMKNPGTAYDDPVIGRDLQVSTYAEVLSTSYPDTFDNGGVHIYSGVPNRAFYLVATNLGGNAWDRAGRIWWSVLSGGNLKPTANFHDFAKLTCAQAESLYGQFVKAVVVQAWKDVGIETEPKPQPPPPPPRLEGSSFIQF
ncbi:zinc metalloprotease [Cristinia sonorae]|uniref:Zinc metalloprotease n=1 Tax=Cristinia sonorae TaxID=1940300 RepID=A0A8K0UTY8_9AGAR|nr:zinc metalloprotease [Cristinia sonorae]